MTQAKDSTDRRVRRTRQALIAAFSQLALDNGARRIRVADVIEQADVARSTFYEHYANAEALHRDALAIPLATLADALTGQTTQHRMTLEELLDHFVENQQRARATLGGAQRLSVVRVLRELIETRLAARSAPLPMPRQMAAIQLAQAPLALIEFWLRGELHATSGELADAIRKFALVFLAIAPDDPTSDPT